MHRSALCSLVVAGFLSACVPASTIPESGFGDVDDLFADYQGSNPGAAVMIIRDKEVIYRKGFGLSNVEENTSVDANSNFRLASITKTFTAAAILQLVESGRLSLDTRLSDVLPGLSEAGSSISIKDLLRHTSGLPDYEKLVPEDQAEQVRDRDVLELLKQNPDPYFPAGEKHQYSNSGYALLALIVEAVSGQSFSDYLAENIFDVAGMTTTVAFDKDVHTVAKRAYGYTIEDDETVVRTDQSLFSAVLGDGGVYSNLNDLYQWDQALFGQKILGRDLLEEALSDQKDASGRQIDYGFGWRLEDYKGHAVAYHTGTSKGFRNILYRIADPQLTIVILTNRNSDAGLTTLEMAREIADIVLAKTENPTDADLVIRNAFVIDGTGTNPGYQADVFIDEGVIVAIDRQRASTRVATEVIDAKGRVLSPGFIDLHSHGSPLTHGEFRNFIAMGVTTISLGQDGFSPDTEDLGEWISDVESNGINPNIAMFLGHGTLRGLAGVKAGAKISTAQQHRMEAILARNLPYVFGMSTGLEYTPALYAEEDELLALARIVGRDDKLIMSHMRNEDDDQVIDSILELVAQGSHARVHVAHLKSVYGKGEARAEQILQVLDDARQQGVRITADVYPYTASYTDIAIVFPDWSKTSEQLEVARRERRAELEKFIRDKVNSRNGPDATLFGTAPYTGKTLAEVATELGKPFEKVLIDDIGPEGASAAYFVMDDALQSRLIADPLVAVSSDGSPVSFHPRGHGSFAKIIEEYVYERKLFPLEAAIHKLTAFPASVLKLENRGVIAEGNHADLLVFDPARVKANATYSSPHQLSSGFDHVLVNGKRVLDEGVFTRELPGKVLEMQ